MQLELVEDKNYQSLNLDNKLENYNEIEDVDDKHNFNNNVDLETEKQKLLMIIRVSMMIVN